MIHLVRKTRSQRTAPRTPPPRCSPRGNIVRMLPVKLKLSCNGTINNPRRSYCVVTSADLRCARQPLGSSLNLTYQYQVQFLLALGNITNRLLIIPEAAWVSALRAELTALSHMLPAEVSGNFCDPKLSPIPVLCLCAVVVYTVRRTARPRRYPSPTPLDRSSTSRGKRRSQLG